jgi:hypothetical protein
MLRATKVPNIKHTAMAITLERETKATHENFLKIKM